MAKKTETIKTPGAGEWGASENKAASTAETPEQLLQRIQAEKAAMQAKLQELESQEQAIQASQHAQKVKTCAQSIKDAGIDLADVLRYFKAQGWPTSVIIDAALAPKAKKVKKEPAPAKYKNPATGETHSGRGNLPEWLKDARDSGTLEQFKIK